MYIVLLQYGRQNLLKPKCIETRNGLTLFPHGVCDRNAVRVCGGGARGAGRRLLTGRTREGLFCCHTQKTVTVLHVVIVSNRLKLS